MTTRIEVATECFRSGFNCAQAVFSTYAPSVGIEEESALRISTGFGAGMGRLQEVCGAVTGAFLLIGAKHGMIDAADTTPKDTAYALEQELARQFTQLHGSILCRDLLKCDLRTAEGKSEYEAKDLFNVVCVPCVRDACRIVEETILPDPAPAKQA
jgi:C_GCAxxG_C_C family probable redox protein